MTKTIEELHKEFLLRRLINIGREYCDRINQTKSDEEFTREICGAMCAAYNKGLLDGIHAGECGKLDYSDKHWDED